MSKLKLCVEDTQDRAVWRNGILGNRLTRAIARKTTLNDDDDDDDEGIMQIDVIVDRIWCCRLKVTFVLARPMCRHLACCGISGRPLGSAGIRYNVPCREPK